MSTIATVLSPWIGFSAGLIAWFVVTSIRSGIIDVSTTGNATNAVAGNITSWGTGAVSAVALTLLFPKKYVNEDPEAVARANKINGIAPPTETPSSGDTGEVRGSIDKTNTPGGADTEKGIAAAPPSDPRPDTLVKTGNEIVDFLEASHIEPMDPMEVKRATRLAVGFNILFLVVAILGVPFGMFGGAFIFSKPAFSAWCVVSFIWVWVSSMICVIYPLVESRGTIWAVAKGIFKDIGAKTTRR